MKISFKSIALLLFVLAIGVLLGRILPGGNSHANHSDQISETGVEIWTCSMHPQIQMPNPGACPICGMDLIPIAMEGSSDEAYDPNAIRMTDRAMQLAQVATTIVGSVESQASLVLNGKIREDESQIVTQTAHFPGRIEALYVHTTGEYIRRGQRIATLYSPALVTTQEELFTAKQLGHEDLVRSVRQKLKLWKLSDQEIDAIESSNTVRTEIDLFSDVAGFVSALHVRSGDHVDEGTDFFTVSDLSRVWVDFEGYERDLGQIAVGDRLTFSVTSLPAETFESKVTFIDPFVDPSSRTAVVRTEVSNAAGRLKPEMLAHATLLPKQQADQHQLLVPVTAVLWTGERSVVYVQVPDSTRTAFVLQEVELGNRIGDAYVVTSGLERGDQIVTNGTFTVDAAAQLQGKKSMMNPVPAQKMVGHSH